MLPRAVPEVDGQYAVLSEILGFQPSGRGIGCTGFSRNSLGSAQPARESSVWLARDNLQ